ncbi:MAG: hypothetical protein LBL08_00660 [Candidatus Nomurabacteria bacterium]|jgi:hypothetical protein|nr:hypothetical protein [Candidatus Nomurabacteria bacterium]
MARKMKVKYVNVCKEDMRAPHYPHFAFIICEENGVFYTPEYDTPVGPKLATVEGPAGDLLWNGIPVGPGWMDIVIGFVEGTFERTILLPVKGEYWIEKGSEGLWAFFYSPDNIKIGGSNVMREGMGFTAERKRSRKE